jgi:hypothetical protein
MMVYKIVNQEDGVETLGTGKVVLLAGWFRFCGGAGRAL